MKQWHTESDKSFYVFNDKGHVICNADTQAHAALIAAAPDLLSAAKAFIKHHQLVCKGEHCQESGIDMLNFAIASAEGSNPL